MDWELVFWIAIIVASPIFLLWVKAMPTDLYYEGRMDKLGGKGGR